MKLSDKTAIVTGGASGIGRAIALLYAREGANVIVADLRASPMEGGVSTQDIFQKENLSGEFIRCDVSRWQDIDLAVRCAVDNYGSLDVMVNNAAILAGNSILNTSEEEWEQIMAVNAKGTFFGCKRAIQQFLQQEPVLDVRGRIVNITSQHGMVCSPEKFAYGVGKAASVYITRQVAVDYAKDHIICNAVAPGRILTGKGEADDGEDPLAYSLSRTPMPRLGTPDDVAKAALFLACNDSTFVTGHNLMVDGGWMAY